MLEAISMALSAVFTPVGVVVIILGTIAGLIFGVLPGLGGIVAVAVLMPFTFGMEPMVAMLFLAAVMGAVPFGGSIPAILINTPGTAPNAATCFDGYPMARRGESKRALGISAVASGLGAIFGLVILVAFFPVVRQLVLAFGPPEFFMLVLIGLATVALAAKGNLLKGLVAGGTGVLLSLIGYSSVFGILRFTGKSEYLWDGIELVPFVVGIFALSEVINYTLRGGKITAMATSTAGSVWQGAKDVFRHKLTFLRSSAIGTGIGIIPGVGGTAANFISYVVAKTSSRTPEIFGTGTPEGVIASESSNNAKDGGALLPTVGFGIPGSGEMAVLLGAFILHGLQPGPMLVREHPEIVFALLLGILLSNILASSFGLLMANQLARVSMLDVRFIAPIVTVLCFVGAYAIRGNIWDVLMALGCGIFGYAMLKSGFPIVCLVIGFVLGVLAERAFHQSLMMSYGSYMIFFSRPASLLLFIVLIVVLFFPFINMIVKRRKSE